MSRDDSFGALLAPLLITGIGLNADRREQLSGRQPGRRLGARICNGRRWPFRKLKGFVKTDYAAKASRFDVEAAEQLNEKNKAILTGLSKSRNRRALGAVIPQQKSRAPDRAEAPPQRRRGTSVLHLSCAKFSHTVSVVCPVANFQPKKYAAGLYESELKGDHDLILDN